MHRLLSLRLAYSAPIILSAIMLASCHSQSNEGSQVVAQVNNEEITVHQQNAESLKLYHSGASQAIDHSKVIDKLIENTLFKQALIQQNLNKQPEIVQAITNAIVDAYAEVYKQHLISDLPLPSNEEILQYQQAHPEYFEKRQLFEVHEIKVNSAVSIYDIEFLAYKAQVIDEAIDWLKQHKIHFAVHKYYLTSDQLRQGFLEKNKILEKESMMLFNDAGLVNIQSVKPIMQIPMTESDAFFVAREKLIGKLRDDKINNELARLKAIADVELKSTP